MHTAERQPSGSSAAIKLNRLAYHFSRHWMLWFSLLYGWFYVGLPFLAPVFMAAGLEPAGRAVYFIYSFLCHQLPERSFFLFGPHFTLSLAQIQSAWTVSDNPLVMRQFIGNPELGWKVAWSDRMVSMYASVLVFAWVFWLFRRNIRPVTWKVLALFLLPMAVDGTTHTVSDSLSGLHHGFRYTNAWLATLTHHGLASTFYAGDAWGSFNSIMRLFTGICFGIGVAWYSIPYLEAYFHDIADAIQYKFQRKDLDL